MIISQADRVALVAAGAVVGAISTVLLLFGPITAKIDPSQLPDPRPVVVSPSYTPFTVVPTKPTRPPHPLSVYIPPGYEGR